jgi:hypothetical protein
MTKPVFCISKNDNSFEYSAMINHTGTLNDYVEFLGCDSIRNLKKFIRDNGYVSALISSKSGYLSYGQNVVDDYQYKSRRRSRDERF